MDLARHGMPPDTSLPGPASHPVSRRLGPTSETAWGRNTSCRPPRADLAPLAQANPEAGAHLTNWPGEKLFMHASSL
jgi:hypothetical protein